MDDDLLEVQELEVPGLYYISDIDEDTSDVIVELDKRKWIPLSTSPHSRLVQHYGFKYNYTTYKINEKCDPIPEFMNKYRDLLHTICTQLNIIDKSYEFNQCIVNNYNDGQGISAHIDVKQYGDIIGCYTFGTGATMVF
jgi:alkylated DNA repair dioxygenase AlkB